MTENITLEHVALEQATQGQRLDQACAGIKRIEMCLVSTDMSNPGLTFQVDRLNQLEKTRKKLFWLGVTAIVGIIVERCCQYVST